MQRLWRLFAVFVLATVVIVAGRANHRHRVARPKPVTTTSSTTTSSTSTLPGLSAVPAATIAQRCPPGAAYMGCSIDSSSSYTPISATHAATAVVTPVGTKFPDVSHYQGCEIDWASVAAPGAAIKLGEGTDDIDPCATQNVAGVRVAGKALVYYWFIRPDPAGAANEAAFIVRDLKAKNLTVSHVVIYTAPGTWPGGSSGGLDTWEAAYSGTLSPPPLPYVTSVLAWQFTDQGSIAGLGIGDESVDFGLLALAPHVLVLDEEVPGIAGYAPVLANYVLTHDAGPKVRTLPHPVSFYDVFENRVFKIFGRRINERKCVEDYDLYHWSVRKAELRLLERRLSYVSRHTPTGKLRKHPAWKPYHRGSRRALMVDRTK